MGKRYYLKDISTMFGVSESLLRYYGDNGIISNFRRDNHDYRYMLEEDLETVKLTLWLKKTGMSLSKIKEYLKLSEKNQSNCLLKIEMIKEQEKIVQDKFLDIQKQVEFLKETRNKINKYIDKDFNS